MADIGRLVEESRRVGMRVTASIDVAAVAEVPGSAGRTAYRVVQEGLTNARKHVPGVEVRVDVSGGRGSGLCVDVLSRRPVAVPVSPGVPGAGLGLAGLAERAALAGGRLEHGPTSGGDFRLHAWLPWPG